MMTRKMKTVVKAVMVDEMQELVGLVMAIMKAVMRMESWLNQTPP